MSEALQQFADVLSARLFAAGWVPTSQAPEGSLRCLVGPGAHVLLVDASSRSAFDLKSEPLVKLPALKGHSQRLVLYLCEQELSAVQRTSISKAAKRTFWGGANSLGLVEIESAHFTLSKPSGWVGAFQPVVIATSIQAAFQHQGEVPNFTQLVESQVDALQQFSDWTGQVKPLWTPLFLGLCLALTGISELSGGSTDSYTLYRMGALWRASVLGLGEWWRLATSTVLHFGWLHLAVNMFTLYSVGTTLEQVLGRTTYLLVLILSGVCGTLFSLLGHDHTLSAGISGALFGLASSTCVLIYTRRLPIPPLAQRALAGGLAPAILYNLLLGFSRSGIDNYAHVGGLVGGALLTWIAYPRASQQLIRHQVPRPLWLVPLLYAGALLVGALSFAAHPLPMSTPLQTYSISGTKVGFGREFKLFNSTGVVRVYILPGCVLALSVTSKSPWPNPEAFLDQLQKELPAMKNSRATVGGHACAISRGRQDDKEVLSARVLDVGPDVVEVTLLGEFAETPRAAMLLEKIVSTIQGTPSHWGKTL
ncbi:rhomboid family intramembrane serine protease [bacterium]|nr:rhomboid family intramembrane serine protease [bacterium]